MRFKKTIALALVAGLVAGPAYAGSSVSSGGSRSSFSSPSVSRSYSAPSAPSVSTYKAPAAPTVGSSASSTSTYKAPAAPTVAAPAPTTAAPAYKAPAAPTVATGVAVGTGAAVAAGGASASTTAPAATVQSGTQTYKAPAAPTTVAPTATPPAPSNLPAGTATATPYKAPPPPAVVANQNKPGATPPAATATATPVPPKPVMSQSAQNITNARNADAIAQMKKEQAAFKAPPPKIDRKEIASNPVVNSAPRYRSYNDYTTRRTTVINQYHYTPPVYINSYAPYYGAYDTLMLTMMLQNVATNAAYASFFHNHQNDPSVQAFLAESRRNAAKEADLQNQINVLNAKLESQKGQAVNPAYVPDDVKDVLVTPKVTVAEVADNDEGGMGFLGWFLTLGLLAGVAAGGIYLVRRSKAERRAMGY